jgi:AAA domain
VTVPLAEPVAGRHPWLLCCFVRLQCMRRNGCLTRKDYDTARQALEARLEKLCATQAPTREVPQDIALPGGKVKPGEVTELHNEAVDKASRKTQAEIDSELGGHEHDELFTGAKAKDAPQGQPDANTAASEGNTQQPTGKPRLWQAAALQSVRQATFLAKNRIPYGAATILCGDEGIGKSLLWVLIVGAVTTGTELAAFGIPAREPADVILILTEDAWAEDVLPRLEVVGADLNRIHVICTEDDGTGSPTFPDDVELITDGGVQPALVVVDAWLDTVAANLSVKDPQQSRAALHPWKEAAGQTGAAILLLTHTNRLDTGNMRDKYGASAALRQKARSTLFALADPDTPGVLLVGPDKANNSRGGTSAARFNIDAVQHWPATADHDGTVPRLKFMGDTGQTIKQHLAAVRDADREQSRAKSGAEIFLRGYLANGPKTAGEVFDAGKVAGFGERQLQRARERCAYTRHVGTPDGNHHWLWILAESANDSGGNDA